jgi:hemerythrin-like domain-containing protein
MMPIAPLMIEHRLIERMIGTIDKKLKGFLSGQPIDTSFIDAAIDFIRIYADKCHHGKEEDILFKVLAKKPLSNEHRRIMDELLTEHKTGRKVVADLANAKNRLLSGDKRAVDVITKCLQTLVDFYPKHIAKEDKNFFIPCMLYFDQIEKDMMLRQFNEFDRMLIHNRYREIVELFEA